MTKFTNTTQGPKGVHTANGLVYIAAGKTSDDLVVSEGDLAAAQATGWFDIAAEVEKALREHSLAELKAIAEAEEIDLGENTKKDDIVAAIELAREAKAEA